MDATDQRSGSIPIKSASPAERAFKMEATVMNDRVVCVTTAEIPQAPPQIIPKPSGHTLAPDLRKALRASFARNEAAYRYLGR